LVFLVREPWPGVEDEPFEVGEGDLPEDVGLADALVCYGEIAAGAINLAAAVFELPAALAIEQPLDGRGVSVCVGKEELGSRAAR
jgi:hypothetical protein